MASAAADDVRLLVEVAATLVVVVATAAASLNVTTTIFALAAASIGAWRYLHDIPYHIPKEHVIAYFRIHFPLYFTPGVGWSALPAGPKCSAEDLATVVPGIYYWREPTRIFFGLSPTVMGSRSEVSRSITKLPAPRTKYVTISTKIRATRPSYAYVCALLMLLPGSAVCCPPAHPPTPFRPQSATHRRGRRRSNTC